jgi:hypothetical protein
MEGRYRTDSGLAFHLRLAPIRLQALQTRADFNEFQYDATEILDKTLKLITSNLIASRAHPPKAWSVKANPLGNALTFLRAAGWRTAMFLALAPRQPQSRYSLVE